MNQDILHALIVERCAKINAWFDEQSAGLSFPFYSSFDIRDANHKVAPVDANIFPAGFNNICPQDKDFSIEMASVYLKNKYGKTDLKIGLLTEEHTNNLYYWENVASIKELLTEAGASVHLAFPRPLDQKLELKSSTGKELTVYGTNNANGAAEINGQKIDLLISNNDFSESYEEFANNLKTPMNPPRELGWHRRTKDQFFTQYNELAETFAGLLDTNPFHFQVKTESFENLDLGDPESLKALSLKLEAFFETLHEQHKAMGIDREPFAFVKNNAGTYGLAVIPVHNPKEVVDWNYKSRKKMKAAKGGRDVTNVIIQEGIPTKYKQGDETAEPCIYVIGRELVGGFLRTHKKKDGEDNLNSPGAVYKRLCMSDMALSLETCPSETVYGWVSKLATLAVAKEAKAGGINI